MSSEKQYWCLWSLTKTFQPLLFQTLLPLIAVKFYDSTECIGSSVGVFHCPALWPGLGKLSADDRLPLTFSKWCLWNLGYGLCGIPLGFWIVPHRYSVNKHLFSPHQQAAKTSVFKITVCKSFLCFCLLAVEFNQFYNQVKVRLIHVNTHKIFEPNESVISSFHECIHFFCHI